MGIILDIILITIVALSTFIGYKKGLIDVVFSLCAFLISIILTMVLYTPITNLVIEHTDFDERIERSIIDKGISNIDESSTENDIIEETVTQGVIVAKNAIIESSASIISKKTIGIIIAILLFIVIRILLIFAKAIINGIALLPFIKEINKTGGLIYGVFRAMVIIYVILAIVFFIALVNNTGAIVRAINSSYVTKLFYNNNIILNVLL